MISPTLYALLVGAHFRPPAVALLSALNGRTLLTLRPEPENPYDPQAMAVFWQPDQGDLIVSDAFIQALAGCGHTLETILDTPEGEWQLGYLARQGNRDLERKAAASPTGVLTPASDAPTGAKALLFWGPNSEPLVQISREE